MKSAIYQGAVFHGRFIPVAHQFRYKLFMTYLDLDELGHIFDNISIWSDNGKRSLAYFNRNDYLSPTHKPLKSVVKTIIAQHTGYQHTGPVRMLTHLRVLGYCFNPVTFYYCFNQADTALEFVIAEITNTPWNERHQYLVDVRSKETASFPKVFHISPFMAMDMDYRWKFTRPNDSVNIAMDVYKDDKRYFVANLTLKKRPITQRTMMELLVRSGLINYKVISGIYWQAAKLYLKKAPVYSHPRYKPHE